MPASGGGAGGAGGMDGTGLQPGIAAATAMKKARRNGNAVTGSYHAETRDGDRLIEAPVEPVSMTYRTSGVTADWRL